MSAPLPLELQLLRGAEAALQRGVKRWGKSGTSTSEARVQLLEACAARWGGFDLAAYHRAFGVRGLAPPAELLAEAAAVVRAVEATAIPPPLALSALAREDVGEADRKKTGAYHTDFRLAQRLAQSAAAGLSPASVVIDPACGTGMLLAALTLQVCGHDRTALATWLRDGVCAADLSAASLRAAVLVLGSLTDDVPALVRMRSRWYHGDSLVAAPDVWRAMAPQGFDAVVGNPPWEKVKLTRHEFLRAAGHERHYGEDTPELQGSQGTAFATGRADTARYAQALVARYPDLAAGEPDLYVAFTALFLALCRPGGVIAALLPGGLIRSQGTQALRQRLFEAAESVSLAVFDNRARFFAIDTRFKFLAVGMTKARPVARARKPISLTHERGTATTTEVVGSAVLGRRTLEEVRPDWSVPEVRSPAEWAIFCKLAANGVAWGAEGWDARFCREVDMTKERPFFLPRHTHNALPVVEGRMVHQHRFGVKGYLGGSGRRALWQAWDVGASALQPQFWIQEGRIPAANRERAKAWRAGFCDIAGQTNERSLMAALVPPGVVCGNKVPTITFPSGRGNERLHVWLAIANSFVFDWALRRVMTTTVNYFLLQSIPLPRLTKGGLPWRRLVRASEELVVLDTAGATVATRERMAALRADIDAEVAIAYGLSVDDLALVLEDFPLLDRAQPRLPGELRSTITRDAVLLAAAKRMAHPVGRWRERVDQAQSMKACAYVPSEIANDHTPDEEAEETHG